jgi:hypothetical protein
MRMAAIEITVEDGPATKARLIDSSQLVLIGNVGITTPCLHELMRREKAAGFSAVPSAPRGGVPDPAAGHEKAVTRRGVCSRCGFENESVKQLTGSCKGTALRYRWERLDGLRARECIP